MGYTANEPWTFVLKLHLHCENCAKDVKKFVLKKINGVDSIDVIDQEQGKVRISGNVEPQTVIEKLKKHMKKHAELLVEEEEEESPPKIENQEMRIANKSVREFSDQRKVVPLLPDLIIKPIGEPMTIKVRDWYRAHDHELELKPYNKPFTCSRCREAGFISGYRCKLCVYDIHKECMNQKPKITHKLFPGSVFEFRKKPHINGSICDACGMIIHGCSYRCEAHNLDLHPRCSDLPGKLCFGGTDFGEPMTIKVRDWYRAHDHELELKPYNKPFTCSRCREAGFISGYRCKLCVYDIHKECMNPKPKITHKLFPGSVFEFRKKPHINGSICDACGMIIHGCSYRCEAHDLDLHPRCSDLPGKLCFGGTDFVLICKNVEHRCFSCKMELHSRLVKKKVPGWCYVSERNKFYCHVYCVSQIVHEAWRRGDLVPDNDDDDDNDGISKALEKLDLKLVANSNGSGGRGGSLFLKAVTVFLKAIVSILFGDPTGLIVYAVTELVQFL